MASSIQWKTKLLLLFIVIHSGVLSGQSRYDTVRYARQHYNKRVANFRNESISHHRIVLLGNSITEFGDWKKLLNDTTVINRGVAGDNTFGILDRLDEVILLMPSRLFVEAGINDISQNIPLDTITKNFFQLAKQVKKKSPGTKLFIYSVLPTNDNVKNEYPDAYNKNHIVRLLNEQLREGAGQNKYTYIDLLKIFADGQGRLNENFAEPDGLHINDAGYKAWTELLRIRGYLK